MVAKSSGQILLEVEDPDVVPALAADYDLSVVWADAAHPFALLQGTADLSALRADPRVEFAQSNQSVTLGRPGDATLGFHESWRGEGEIQEQASLAGLSMRQVHPYSRGSGVRVAVLDTGIDPQHPALAGRFEIPDLPGWDLRSAELAAGVDRDNDGEIDEAYGHGTHVAGLIASIAPDAILLPIVVLDSDGVGTDFDVARGLLAAYEVGADAVNMSLSFGVETEVIASIVEFLEANGVVLIAAGGNEPGDARFPANHSDVIGVAALDHGRTLADFSADSNVQLGAPGVGLRSAFPGNRTAVASGTSMSSAVTTGLVAVALTLPNAPVDRRELVEWMEQRFPPVVDAVGIAVDPDDLRSVDPLALLPRRNLPFRPDDARP